MCILRSRFTESRQLLPPFRACAHHDDEDFFRWSGSNYLHVPLRTYYKYFTSVPLTIKSVPQ